MAESFGARLRQRREEQQISLTAIADRTKINPSHLEALERDDVSHWPVGIFRRAFIRAYAQAIDLDPDTVVREFLELYPDPDEAPAPVPATMPGVDGADMSLGPPTRLRCLMTSAMGSLSQRWTGFAGKRPSPLDNVENVESVVSIADDASPAAEREPVQSMSSDPMVVPPSPPPSSTSAPVLSSEPSPTLSPTGPDLLAAAHLCTDLGRIYERQEAVPLLERVADILDAVGLIVWAWDAQGTELKPALAHGYSDRVLAQLPKVRRDADNATAAAFRSTQTCIVNGSDEASGAVVVPLMTPGGCVGVFAVELQHGGEQREPVRALATIFAAQLATMIGAPRLPQAVSA
jgi:hypothetical protein